LWLCLPIPGTPLAKSHKTKVDDQTSTPQLPPRRGARASFHEVTIAEKVKLRG
jgi:hypothetical protein